MKLSSSFPLTPESIPVSILKLLVLVKLSNGFLPPAFWHVSARSPQQPPFPAAPIQNRLESQTSVCSWSKIAEFDAQSSSFCLVDPDDVSEIERSGTLREGKESFSPNLKHDLVSPRGWLEYCEESQMQKLEYEQKQQRGNDGTRLVPKREQYGGAYTVLRCDFVPDETSWKIWGGKFHLDRLRESYRLLLHRNGYDAESHQEIDQDELNCIYEEEAIESSLEVMKLLLKETKKTILCITDKTHPNEKEGKFIVTAMLTLLWETDNNYSKANKGNDKSKIRVQGHVFSTLKPSQLQINVNQADCRTPAVKSNPNVPVQTVIAYFKPTVLKRNANNHDLEDQLPDPAFLPNRYQNYPGAKLSSWCRQRRLLEDVLKTKDIGEVILAKYDFGEKRIAEEKLNSLPVATTSNISKQSLELLEGLTSNLFVVYPGKILRTAPLMYVLGGYVRHLVIACAEKCGYKVEFRSISVADSSSWEEVFLTSSIRLIIPVNRIFLPTDSDHDKNNELIERETLWEMPADEGRENDDCLPPSAASHTLYTEILRLSASHDNDGL